MHACTFFQSISIDEFCGGRMEVYDPNPKFHFPLTRTPCPTSRVYGAINAGRVVFLASSAKSYGAGFLLR